MSITLSQKSAAYIKRARHILNKSVKSLLYYTYKHSHLNYMAAIWENANRNVLDKLQRVQNRAVKLIYNCNRFKPITDVYGLKQLINMNKIVLTECIKLVHKKIRIPLFIKRRICTIPLMSKTYKEHKNFNLTLKEDILHRRLS